MSAQRQVRDGRQTAQRYLDRRDLGWPHVPWAQLCKIYKQAQGTGR
jgi:hypothetical protein